MTISKINRIISILMAMLLFVSSTGFSIDLHYCQGHIKSFSLIGKATSCHQKVEQGHCKKRQKACHATPTSQEKDGNCKKDCCSNKTIRIDKNDDAKKLESVEFSQQQVKFFTAFAQVFILQKQDLRKIIIPHLNYIPPLLDKKIPILIQSFLL